MEEKKLGLKSVISVSVGSGTFFIWKKGAVI